jgi:hypothetical protein
MGWVGDRSLAAVVVAVCKNQQTCRTNHIGNLIRKNKRKTRVKIADSMKKSTIENWQKIKRP